MLVSLTAANYTNKWIIKEIMEIAKYSKSLHSNDIRSGEKNKQLLVNCLLEI